MRDVEQKMLARAKELLENGEVVRVVGWKKGEFYFDPAPAVFETVDELKDKSMSELKSILGASKQFRLQRFLRCKPF